MNKTLHKLLSMISRCCCIPYNTQFAELDDVITPVSIGTLVSGTEHTSMDPSVPITTIADIVPVAPIVIVSVAPIASVVPVARVSVVPVVPIVPVASVASVVPVTTTVSEANVCDNTGDDVQIAVPRDAIIDNY
jgi:hypothetical protein